VNSHDLRLLLAERAADVDDVRVDRVDGVHRRVRSARRARVAGAAAVAVVLAAVVGVAVTAPGGDPHSEEPVAPPDQAPTDPLDQYRAVPDTTLEEAEPLDPGTWMVEGIGPPSTPRVILDVPSGYLGSGGFLVASDRRPLREVGYWAPTHVVQEPCRGQDSAYVEPARTAAQMAADFAAQRHSRTTTPVPVTIGGYEGLTFTLTTKVKPSTCEDTVFQPFAAYDGGRWLHETGAVERYWVLDVEGQVLLFSATVGRGVTDRQAEEMAQIVESAHFPELE